MADPDPSDPFPTLSWEYLAHSEVGLVRKNNQDSGLVSDHLLLVADGMGGAAAGDLASAAAVDTFAGLAGDQQPSTDREDLDRLAEAIDQANTRIADLVTTDHTLEGMGTTVTAGYLSGATVGLAHIGDSRGYLFSDGRLEQLTHDHSWVQSLIDDGKISQEEAANHPHRSLLLKVLNGQPANDPDLTSVAVRPGDRLLLCSDGLCGFVEDPEIADALNGTTRQQAMDQLVAAAHRAGGLDNITIVIADLMDVDATQVISEPDDAEPTDSPYVSGPTGSVHLLGSATERDVGAVEASIRERAAAEQAAGDDGDADAQDEDRYAPQAPRRHRWRRPLILLLVVILVLGAGAAAGYAWTRTQYYVGAQQDQVAIFQGLNDPIPVLPVSRVYEVQDLKLSELPTYYQGRVRNTIEVGSLESARQTVRQLEETAERCRRRPEPPPNGPSPGGSSTPQKPTQKPAPSASPSDSSPGQQPPGPGC